MSGLMPKAPTPPPDRPDGTNTARDQIRRTQTAFALMGQPRASSAPYRKKVIGDAGDAS